MVRLVHSPMFQFALPHPLQHGKCCGAVAGGSTGTAVCTAKVGCSTNLREARVIGEREQSSNNCTLLKERARKGGQWWMSHYVEVMQTC